MSLADDNKDGYLTEEELFAKDYLLSESSLVNVKQRLHSDL